MAYITPDPHMLVSMTNSGLGWHKALGELIDNSFDAGALQVSISIARKKFTIVDDGEGAEDVLSMLTLGSHKRHRTTALGQYGIGLKDAWLWLGHTINIDTHHKGRRSEIRIRFPDDVSFEGGAWECPDPVYSESVSGAKGTIITIEGLLRKVPDLNTINRLGMTFMPAIESGKQITFAKGNQRIPIEAYKLPMLMDAVQESFQVDGRDTSIHIGIARDGDKIKYPGFLFCYGHRVILNSSIGTGDYSAPRLTGKVVLGSGWKLTKNKDDLSDLKDDLANAIYDRIQWICQKAQSLSEDVESQELLTEVERSINESLRNAKTGREKRDPPENNTGSVEPKITGRKRRKSKKQSVLLGNIEVDGGGTGEGTDHRRRGIKLDWYEDYDGSKPIGCVDPMDARVRLNTLNSYVSRIKSQRNQEALFGIAMGLVAHHSVMHAGRQKLLIDQGDFIESWGAVMDGIVFSESPKRDKNGTA